MSYWRYWKLNTSPFAGETDPQLFRGESVEEALARVDFLLDERRQLGLLVGPSGVGKSMLLAYLFQRPPRIPNRPFPQVCHQSMLGLAPGELPCRIAQKLSGRPVPSTEQAWKRLADHLASMRFSDAQALILLDDVESCSLENEADLIRLANSTSKTNITMLMASESHLTSALSQWLVHRSSLQIELAPWSADQTGQFLSWKLQQCGRHSTVFSQSAADRLSDLSRGIPRKILQMAELALVAGAAQRATVIDATLISQAANELPMAAAA